MKKTFLHKFLWVTLLTVAISCFYMRTKAQSGPIKVDFNMSGRKDSEVNEGGYTPWAVSNPLHDTLSEDGVTFVVSKGKRGDQLAMTWYKAGVQSPNFAKFSGDALFVKDGDFDQGSEIDMKISGLNAGHHTLITYHNITDNLQPGEACPIDIHVNGVEVVSNLIPTVRQLTITTCQKAELSFDVTEGEDVEIRFIADTTGTQLVKNIFINGFQLDGISVADKSHAPFPEDKDEHVEPLENRGLTLSWSPSAKAVSQDIYFGTDSLQVAHADHDSPLFKGNQVATDTSFEVSDLYSRNQYYWRVDAVSEGQVYKGDVWYFKSRQLAFRDAEGYGRFAIGGRGGKVVEVTNLNDDGPGSLRWAVTNDIGPRTIVFAVSGLIKLKSRLVLNQPHVTVAGQTAPGKGITIRSAPFGITGNDCIARFIRVRIGGGTTYDGMGLTGANNSIMDHCSISWTIDESFSSRGAHNITLQRTLISEALNAAGHQNYPPGTEHGYAATIGGDIGSFHHNLLADCYGRNWSLGGGLNGDGYYGGRLDISNNVVYNWGHRATDGGAHEVNFVNNYYKPGAGTNFFYAFNAQHEGVGLGMQRCYFNGNVMPGYFDESNQQDGRTISHSNGDTSSYETYVDAPFFPNYISLQSAGDAYKSVLSDVGAFVPMLDEHDQRIIRETIAGTYSVVGSVTGKPGFPDNEADAGGFEDYPEVYRPDYWDSDHDGLPDWWETVKGLNPNSAPGDFSDSNADDDKDGFTNLEDYLDWLAVPHKYAAENGPVSINLKALARGYQSAPVFTIIRQPDNGSVVIKQDTIAVYIPARVTTAKAAASRRGYSLDAFSFRVQDSEGSSMERTVNLALGVDQTLRVEMADLKVTRQNDHQVKLSWTTHSEENNKSFRVQKSATSTGQFVNTGKQVLSKALRGNSSKDLHYHFTDVNSSTATTFYRLQQIDLNGTVHYSTVKQVPGATPNTHIKLWPVPSSGQVNIDLRKIKTSTLVKIYDINDGRLVLNEAASMGTVKKVYLKNKGIYIVEIVRSDNHKKVYQGKIVIQ